MEHIGIIMFILIFTFWAVMSLPDIVKSIINGSDESTFGSPNLYQESLGRRTSFKYEEYTDTENECETFINTYLNPKNQETYTFKDLKVNAKGCKKNIREYIKNNLKYHKFLKTPYWTTIANKVKKEANYACEYCSAINNLEVHHLTYDNHGREHKHWRNDLICLCRECHQEEHDNQLDNDEPTNANAHDGYELDEFKQQREYEDYMSDRYEVDVEAWLERRETYYLEHGYYNEDDLRPENNDY